ncbi:MAG: hypothetical protein LBJ90_04095 [Treponema sp.]|jgi:hypothetical protein|nr:hypothetical protein [Treponema sp.]
MGGFIYRFGVRVKDKGEQLKWNRLIRLGLFMRDFVLRHGVIEYGKIKIK